MLVCDIDKLPEEIKQKAQEYAKHKRPQFRTFGISSYDIENAWLQGFAMCLLGKVKVEIENKTGEHNDKSN